MGRVKPTQSDNQVVDVGSDAHLWAFMGSSSADSPPWQFYDQLLPVDSESLFQMQQQRTIFNTNYPWNGLDFDIENLKAMQEIPVLQQTSAWGESDGASPNSQNYVLSDSRDSSPCVSTNAASESDAHRHNMGDSYSGFRDDFKALPLTEQHKLLSSETDYSRKAQLTEIFMDNVSQIKARVFDDMDVAGVSTNVSKLEAAKPRGGQGNPIQPRTSNSKERLRELDFDADKKEARRGVLPNEEMPFSCTRCGVGCRDKTSLRKHMYVHQPRRYFCESDGCNIGFHTKRDLRRHTDTKHGKAAAGVIGSRVRRKSFICKIAACERGRTKPFSRRDNARQHVVGVHGIKNTRGEAEKVIEEIDIDIEGDTAPEPVEESKSPTVHRAESKPLEAPIKPSATDRVPPVSSHKITKPKESEDVFAEFTNLQEERQSSSVTKGNSSGQPTQALQKKVSASEPGDIKPPIDSGLPTAQAEPDEQFKSLHQQLISSSSLLASSQFDTPGEDIDQALDIWEQMAKAEKNGTAPPIDPSSLFDFDMLAGFAKMHI
ncbi:hypothetical protein AOL_s00080g214 [Orbilia oligospora ATCC 24927]|uniref:C2H2-type domain-containing protein n=2 Tax=Orbilia oligospora TaxID=2813651 RepID=G1XEH9_ARTOA|nr:hypothetical protein AOL_s00080g214 [Orbilia oligospora ATCC 24927]EGX48585.1 hypothetical protein AOL_s00080g214 [Orbilia oligospora ATCC 24927]KAF3277025.1 hypothetical protein TWF970_005893 [Orbilia oligospora]